MSIINVFALTFSVISMTFTGQAPVSIWLPLFEDIGMIIIDKVMNILEVLM